MLPSSQTKKNSWKKTHASVTVTVVRDRKIQTALRTNQIVGFVTLPAWKKIILIIPLALGGCKKIIADVCSWYNC